MADAFVLDARFDPPSDLSPEKRLLAEMLALTSGRFAIFGRVEVALQTPSEAGGNAAEFSLLVHHWFIPGVQSHPPTASDAAWVQCGAYSRETVSLALTTDVPYGGFASIEARGIRARVIGLKITAMQVDNIHRTIHYEYPEVDLDQLDFG